MQRFTLRIGAIALAAVLFHCQPVLAGCAELCNGNQCNPAPNFPRWGCGISGPVCFDFDCGPFDRGLMEKIEKAVAAGDQNLISLLAASAGQPIRVHDQNGLVYDGFALAGLEGPGAGNRSSERLAACQSKPAAASSEEAATAAAVPADDAAATAAQDR